MQDVYTKVRSTRGELNSVISSPATRTRMASWMVRHHHRELMHSCSSPVGQVFRSRRRRRTRRTTCQGHSFTLTEWNSNRWPMSRRWQPRGGVDPARTISVAMRCLRPRSGTSLCDSRLRARHSQDLPFPFSAISALLHNRRGSAGSRNLKRILGISEEDEGSSSHPVDWCSCCA